MQKKTVKQELPLEAEEKAQLLVLKGNFPSRNEYEQAIRVHYTVGGKMKKELTNWVAWECKAQKIKKCEFPVLLVLSFYEKDMKRDSDNIYAAVKFIKDGIVKAGVIPNDTRKWCLEKILPIMVDKENPRIEIYFEKQKQ